MKIESKVSILHKVAAIVQVSQSHYGSSLNICLSFLKHLHRFVRHFKGHCNCGGHIQVDFRYFTYYSLRVLTSRFSNYT